MIGRTSISNSLNSIDSIFQHVLFEQMKVIKNCDTLFFGILRIAGILHIVGILHIAGILRIVGLSHIFGISAVSHIVGISCI